MKSKRFKNGNKIDLLCRGIFELINKTNKNDFEDIISNKNIKIVLVNPSHPGNIGGAARAMKTMNLRNSY